MNAWEIECGRIEDENIDEAEQFELQKKMLEDIFARYCKDKKRINGRPNTIYLMERRALLIMTRKRRK